MAESRDDLRSPRVERAKKKLRLLDQIGEIGLNLTQACAVIGIDRTTLYRWRRSDPKFDRDLREAEGHADDSALRHAIAEMAAEREAREAR